MCAFYSNSVRKSSSPTLVVSDLLCWSLITQRERCTHWCKNSWLLLPPPLYLEGGLVYWLIRRRKIKRKTTTVHIHYRHKALPDILNIYQNCKERAMQINFRFRPLSVIVLENFQRLWQNGNLDEFQEYDFIWLSLSQSERLNNELINKHLSRGISSVVWL